MAKQNKTKDEVPISIYELTVGMNLAKTTGKAER
jgi:hypothetical protein